MKLRNLSILLILALCLSSLSLFAVAQSKPNVSGMWKMNAEKSKFERSGPKGITIKFEQQESTLKEALTLANEGGEETFNFTYSLDGKESAQELAGQPIKASAKWEGATLVLQFKSEEGFSFVRKVTVSADGKTMTLAVTQSSPDGTVNDTVVLDKQ